MTNITLLGTLLVERTSLLLSLYSELMSIIAYAIYFDHKRRNDPEFRKALKRESRKQARAAKEEAEAQGAQQKRAIRSAVEEAREEGFPTDVEEKEAYFMNEVGRGETLCAEGMLAEPAQQSRPRRANKACCRIGPDRGGVVLLQSLEGVSATWRFDKHLRQDGTKAGA